MGNKSRMAAAHTNTDHNMREIQFGPRRPNPKPGSKQIWIPHGHKYDSTRYVVSWKICGVVLVLVGNSLVTALSQASMPLLPWTGKVWKMVIRQKFSSASPPAAARPYVCIKHHNHLLVQISFVRISIQYLSASCHIFVGDHKYIRTPHNWWQIPFKNVLSFFQVGLVSFTQRKNTEHYCAA